MFGLQTAIVDDLGKRHTLRSIGEMLTPDDAGGEADPGLRAVHDRMEDASRDDRFNPKITWDSVRPMLPFVPAFLIGPVLAHILQLPFFVTFMGVLIVIGVIVSFLPTTITSAAAQRQINTFTYYAHCAACGFDLRGLTPDAHDHVHCPECAAAWRADRFAPAAVLDALAPAGPAPTKERPTPSHVEGRGYWTPWKMPAAPSILDAMQRPVPMLAADFSNIPAARRELIPIELRLHAMNEAGTWVHRLGRVLVWGTVFLFLLFAIYNAAPSAQFTLSLQTLIQLAAVSFYAWLCCIIILSIRLIFAPATVIRRERFVAALLIWGYCPSCGTRFEDEPYVHNLVRCPCCAAAWERTSRAPKTLPRPS